MTEETKAETAQAKPNNATESGVNNSAKNDHEQSTQASKNDTNLPIWAKEYDEEEAFPEGLSQSAYARRARLETKRSNLIIGWSRFIVVVPVIGLLLAAIVLTVVSVTSTGHIIYEAAIGEFDSKDLLVEFVELADIFLLAVVLYIMSLGLYSLFISDDLPLPHWLEFHTLNDLKEKLIAVVGVALAVYFFGRVVGGDQPINVLYEGIGIAAVIFALAYFMQHVLKKKK